MVYGDLDLIILELGHPANSLDVSEHEEIRSRIIFFDGFQSRFAFIRITGSEVTLRKDEPRHVRVVLVADLTAQCDRFLCLRYSGFGRMIYAVGDNPVAARLSGVKSWQVLLLLYVLSAVLAAIGGFLISGLNNVASVTLADSYLLPSVAAAVIGGTSILGGRGGYAGTIVGALILTVLTSILSSLGYPEAVRQILFGAIIVLVAAGYARVTSQT